MSEILRRVQTLALANDIRISEHGYEELRKDDIALDEVLAGIATAVLVEEYRKRDRGLSVLTLQIDRKGQPIHVVWGLPAGERRPAVLVTAYRPDPEVWDNDFRARRIR